MKVITTKSVNLRYGEPHRRAPVKGILHEDFQLEVEPVDGENINGNNKWYIDKNGDFIWSGGTKTIPEIVTPENIAVNAVHWGIYKMTVDKLWTENIVGNNIHIAVLDSGINLHHPDLKHAVIKVVDKSSSGNTEDKTGHGSHVAGTIAARRRQSDFQGVAPSSKLNVVKIRHDNAGLKIDATADGIDWVLKETESKIINLSLKFFTSSSKLEQQIAKARAKNVILVAAADGISEGTISFPARLPQCISVGAANWDDEKMILDADSETIIEHTDIIAPGINIWSTSNTGNSYRIESGTSMATAFVSGIIALMIQHLEDRNIPYNPDKIMEIIKSTASDIQNKDGKIFSEKLINPQAIINRIDHL